MGRYETIYVSRNRVNGKGTFKSFGTHEMIDVSNYQQSLRL